jgi:fermentation-respiration switch protein FrsA (DUF1100 family)
MSDASSTPVAAEQPADDRSAQPKKTRVWVRILRSTLLTYILIVVVMTVLQRSLIYHPRKANELSAASYDIAPEAVYDFEYHGADGESLNGWYFRRNMQPAENAAETTTQLKDSPQVVLYFPGNAGNRSSRVERCRMLAEFGADVLIADYRGYGDNPGSPSEDVLISDAHCLWDYVTGECGVPHGRVILYGESLGGGMAVRLAADLSRAGTPPAGLVIRSSFNSLGDVGQTHYPFLPVKWVLWDQFDSESHICDINCRYLHVHGDRDEVVPYECGKCLFDAAPDDCDKCFVTLEGAGHNDIYVRRESFVKFSRELRQWLEATE